MLLLKISYTALIGRNSAFCGRGQKERLTKTFSSVFRLSRASARREGQFYAPEFSFSWSVVPPSRRSALASFHPCARSALAPVPPLRLFRPCARSVLALVPSLRSFRSRARSVIAPVPPSRLFRSRVRSVIAPVPSLRSFRSRARSILTRLQSRARSGIPAVWPECRGAAGGDPIHRFWKSGAGDLSGRVRFSPDFTQTAASRHSTTSG